MTNYNLEHKCDDVKLSVKIDKRIVTYKRKIKVFKKFNCSFFNQIVFFFPSQCS